MLFSHIFFTSSKFLVKSKTGHLMKGQKIRDSYSPFFVMMVSTEDMLVRKFLHFSILIRR